VRGWLVYACGLRATSSRILTSFVRMSSAQAKVLTPVESAKQRAARDAVDEFVKDGMSVGIGSGSTVEYAVARIIEKVQEGKLSLAACVPTSFQAKQLITEGGLPLSDLSRSPKLDVCIDGADELDSTLNLIKGGGGCQTQEKIVASCAKQFVVIVDYRKDSQVLGEKWKKGVPLEVLPMAYTPVLQRVTALGGRGSLRMAVNKAGPVVTDNGNFVIDADFGRIEDPAALNRLLQDTPGILETGLFIGMTTKVFIGHEDGTVSSRTPPPSSRM